MKVQGLVPELVLAMRQRVALSRHRWWCLRWCLGGFAIHVEQQVGAEPLLALHRPPLLLW